ncbi:hypothetical protein AVEN_173594-1 [Araneus ventricosus]|uniref:Uncharacterized protein n=1 Tax=Araneus ventricosus TaxID=182803 RepID=A0A4Y2CRT1_ARAVE|nr:hypothetical protein AVEN_173594-1 [Araneus ventricosus]
MRRLTPCTGIRTVFEDGPYEPHGHYCTRERDPAYLYGGLSITYSVCLQVGLGFYEAPQFQLHKILWVAVSSTVGLHVERRHHLQSVCLQDGVLVDQTDENRLELSLVGQCYNIHLTAQT